MSSLDSYFNTIAKYEILPLKEERKLCKDLAKKGAVCKAAKDKLILSNLRLVVKLAKEYQGRGLDLEDLITEGNIGLVKSVGKFNLKYKNKFCTYASYWIRHHITRAIEVKGRAVRVPTHAIHSATKIFKFRDKYKEDYGEEPSIEDICENVKVTKKTARNILKSMGGTINLDAPIKEMNATYAEIIPDNFVDVPDKFAESSDEIRLLHQCLHKLNEKERKVLTHRFGLDNQERETLEKIGERLGLTRERIRQIQGEALKKIRSKLTSINK
jgi:RNA polymerase primary sigma factor